MTFTKEQQQELKAYDDSLNAEQKEWVAHKCNWEHMSRWAVLTEYRGHIDSINANPNSLNT